MEIKDLKLIPPSKRATAFLRNFMKEHDKGLKAIKALAEIKEIVNICKLGNCNSECEFYNTDDCQDERLYKIKQILQKINEAQNGKN